ncbi:MAG: hypothetical protein ACK5LZ_01600 [Anaerorhabdus sp.]
MKWIIMMIAWFSFVIPVASEECETVLWYSHKAWQKHEDLVDVSFNQGVEFINSNGLQVSTNLWGTIDFPKGGVSQSLTGEKPLVEKKKTLQNNPYVVSFSFHQNIQIGDVDFEISATDASSGKKIEGKLYLDVGSVRDFNEDTKMVYSWTSSQRQRINLKNKVVKNMFFVFDTNAKEVIYTLSYFQIKNYRKYEHQKWSQDIVDGAEIYSMRVCRGDGNFTPNGTESAWEKEVAVAFSPSLEAIKEEVPLLEKQFMIYDRGRGEVNFPYVAPSNMLINDNFSDQIISWKSLGEIPYIAYQSQSKDGEYIMIDKKAGIQYVSLPMYWDYKKNSNYSGAMSYNKQWCEHVAGGKKSPCYKHYGHITNPKRNVFDIQLNLYTGVLSPEESRIKQVDYYLIKDKVEQFLFWRTEEIVQILLQQTGSWKIKAIIENQGGMKTELMSKEFLIDQEDPIIDFDKAENGIKITVNDRHSGVKKWSYWISKDGGRTKEYQSDWLESEEVKVELSEDGVYTVGVFCEDKVGNSRYAKSDEIIISNQTLAIQKILAPVYERGKVSELFVSVQCGSCAEESPQRLVATMNDILIIDEMIEEKTVKKRYEYIPTSEKIAQLKIILPEKQLEMTIHEKSEMEVSGVGQVVFEDVVVSAWGEYSTQLDFVEKFEIKLKQDRKNYFSGEGIEHQIEVDYLNECIISLEFECDQSRDFLYDDPVYIEYEDAAKEVSEKFRKESNYVVPLEKDNQLFRLPLMFAELASGIIHDERQEEIEMISAGRKWYTNPNGDKGQYGVRVTGEKFGINQNTWLITGNYMIDSTYQDQYHIRFAKIDDPFPHGASELWAQHLGWIKNLSLELPLYHGKIKR